MRLFFDCQFIKDLQWLIEKINLIDGVRNTDVAVRLEPIKNRYDLGK